MCCHPEAQRGICFSSRGGNPNREENHSKRALRQGTAPAVPTQKKKSAALPLGAF
jgi:hypothetical protein